MIKNLFPFTSYIFSTAKNRDEIAEIITAFTFLSDAGYKKSDNHKKLFWGIVSNTEFYLQTIDKNSDFVEYLQGGIKGVDREMFLFVSFGAFRYRRIYALVLLFFLSSLFFLGYNLYLYGYAALFEQGAVMMAVLSIAVLTYICILHFNFKRQLAKTIAFVEEKLDAKIVQKDEVPLVFQL